MIVLPLCTVLYVMYCFEPSSIVGDKEPNLKDFELFDHFNGFNQKIIRYGCYKYCSKEDFQSKENTKSK
ncbi:hypothetical protein scyTo_0015265 [Scyliorhinus torazame]|uniref:Uncharacterized protein n=1 Tax=Scyliorhinus torazame TaxID=75743 RepID=A0A401P750_SCYTO|nr:hypothetical protein [Scyliorhinus torazame]